MADVAAFLAMLPQFGDVNTSTIQTYLDFAAETVTDEWLPDQDRAQILLAAHQMSLLGIGPEKGASALIGVKSLRSGSFTITKDDSNPMGDFALTSFGRLYWPIQQGIRSGPRVTGTGDYPWPYGQSNVPDPYDAR